MKKEKGKIMSQKDEEKLSVRQRKLADGYLAGMTANDAAVAAGYSKNSARSTAGPLRLPQVKAYIARERKRLAEEEGMMTPEELAGWLTRVIRHKPDGSGRDGELMEMEVTEVMEASGVRGRVRSLDKLEAVRQLAKLTGCDKAPKAEPKMDAFSRLFRDIRDGRIPEKCRARDERPKDPEARLIHGAGSGVPAHYGYTPE